MDPGPPAAAAEPSFGGPDENQNQQDVEGVKSWERPWTIHEMRRSSKNWTLAADAGVRRWGLGYSYFLLYYKFVLLQVNYD